MDTPLQMVERARFLVKTGARKEASVLLDTALTADPGCAPALAARIQLAFEEKQFEIAIHHLRALLQRVPANNEARTLLIKALGESGRWAEACEYYAQLQRSGYHAQGFHENYAEALCRMGDFAGAVEQYEMLRARSGLYADQLHALGHCHNALGNFTEAKKAFEEGLAQAPGHGPCRNALMLLTLKTSNMKQGLDAYVMRYKTGSMALRHYPFPVWEGQSLRGKRLLIWAEQGMGDVMMFCGFLPKVMEECAAVTLEMYPAMISLFARSFPEMEVTPLYDVANSDFFTREFDYHCPMGNLLLLLKEYKPATLPRFLQANPERVTHYKNWLNTLAPGRKIGISWYTEMKESGPIRNIPLQQWKPLFETPGCQFVSLQYGDCATELEAFRGASNYTIHRDESLDPVQDKEGFAALIAALDGVVSIQNSTVHMAGALGVPTWILLSVCSDFRWGIDQPLSDFYRSVRIIRQKKYGEWNEVMCQAAEICCA